MHCNLLRDLAFWQFLWNLDREFADNAQKGGCCCGGRLNVGNYFRSPRGGPDELPKEWCIRLSFCCGREGCRKRLTPPSARFRGPKGLSVARDLPGGGHATGPFAAVDAGVARPLRRQSADHRPLAGVVARALSPDPLLEGRAGSAPAAERSHVASPGTRGGFLYQPRRPTR